MITLLKKNNYSETLWKNGLGTTSQISIFPDNAKIESNNFLWRVSSAQINKSNPFSLFPDCNRWLVVWTGKGLLLNGKALNPDSPLFFSGEDHVECDLIDNEPVVDFGIIFKKNLVSVELKILEIISPINLEFKQGIHFLFLANSTDDHRCFVNEHNLNTGDCLKIEGDEEIKISNLANTTLQFFHIKISGI